MTFLKRRRRREMSGAITTTTTTTTKATTRVVAFILVAAAAVISVGYIMALAILAPQQLAEATAAASDVVCSGCVGTTDIADGGVTTADIGSGQVGNSDIASNAVTSAKIASGGVANSDIATNAVTSTKISDTSGVQSVDIVNGQVTSADIGDGQVTSADIGDGQVNTNDLASDAVRQNIQVTQGTPIPISPGATGASSANCGGGGVVAGGYEFSGSGLEVFEDRLITTLDEWRVQARNVGNEEAVLTAYAVCIWLALGNE